jgi:L,D-peptidoglycan transpeptidase YkuD (ErfK/YbiS/YcfS/YnhG family)
MGLHGGGTGVEDPFAAQQGWAKTEGCIRVQNKDLEEIVKFIKPQKSVKMVFYM